MNLRHSRVCLDPRFCSSTVWVHGGERVINIIYSQATDLSEQASQYPLLPIQNLDICPKRTELRLSSLSKLQIRLIKQQLHRLQILPNTRHHHLPSPIFLRLVPQRRPDRISHVQTVTAFKTDHRNPEMAEKVLAPPCFRRINHTVSLRDGQWRVDSDDQGRCFHLIERDAAVCRSMATKAKIHHHAGDVRTCLRRRRALFGRRRSFLGY
jgi:hypothetical protein